MRRAVAVLVALALGDVIARSVAVGFLLLIAIGGVLLVRAQWRATTRIQQAERADHDRYVEEVNAEYEVEIDLPDTSAPPAAAAAEVYVGLMRDGERTGPRKRARVHLDGMVRFVRPVVVPMPLDGYDAVGIWEDDVSFGGEPLVRLSPWLCTTETDDGNVSIA